MANYERIKEMQDEIRRTEIYEAGAQKGELLDEWREDHNRMETATLHEQYVNEQSENREKIGTLFLIKEQSDTEKIGRTIDYYNHEGAEMGYGLEYYCEHGDKGFHIDAYSITNKSEHDHDSWRIHLVYSRYKEHDAMSFDQFKSFREELRSQGIPRDSFERSGSAENWRQNKIDHYNEKIHTLSEDRQGLPTLFNGKQKKEIDQKIGEFTSLLGSLKNENSRQMDYCHMKLQQFKEEKKELPLFNREQRMAINQKIERITNERNKHIELLFNNAPKIAVDLKVKNLENDKRIYAIGAGDTKMLKEDTLSRNQLKEPKKELSTIDRKIKELRKEKENTKSKEPSMSKPRDIPNKEKSKSIEIER